MDADEILLLSRGWVSERGTHGELMALGHYAQLFEMQSQGPGLKRNGPEAHLKTAGICRNASQLSLTGIVYQVFSSHTSVV